jgi:hypothetical protein
MMQPIFASNVSTYALSPLLFICSYLTHYPCCVTPYALPVCHVVYLVYSKHAGVAQGQGLVTHFLFAGPTLVGEVVAGFVCGPVIMDLVPTMVEDLEVVGRIAMMVVLFERGLYTNFSSIAQCGAIGALMAILGITLPMTLVTIAMRVNGTPFIESLCAGCVMSTTVVGLVDIGWRRAQVKEINPYSTLASKVIDAGTTINSMLIMSVLSVLRSISPESLWYHPQSEWWAACQPMLFSLAFLVAGIFLRSLFSFFCLKDVFGSFFPPKSDPTSELYNTLEFAQVCFLAPSSLPARACPPQTTSQATLCTGLCIMYSPGFSFICVT